MRQTVEKKENQIGSLTDLFSVIHKLEKAKANYSIYTVNSVEKEPTRQWVIEVKK